VVFSIVACAASICLAPRSDAQVTGMAALEALSTALQAEVAWQASYRQEYIAAGMGAGEEVTGKVVVGWPDRAVFVADSPSRQQMGLDGRLVRLLDAEIPSCDEHLLDDDEWARVPLAAVLDPRGAVDRFSVLDHGDLGFVLVPREPGGVERVIVVLGEGHLPNEVIVVDPQGSTNHLWFSGWESVQGPPNGVWLPEPPLGLDCISDS
jgi:hypothetical protein